MGLSEKIINLRKSNNLTQEELAKRLFVTRQAIFIFRKFYYRYFKYKL